MGVRRVLEQVQPFDIVLFRGTEFMSDLIRFTQARALSAQKRARARLFSHLGFVVDSTVVLDAALVPGRKYILESTISGKLGQGVRNVHGHAFLGVQVRDFEALVRAYDKSKHSRVAWLPLADKYRARVNLASTQEAYDHFLGQPYDANPYTLCAAVWRFLRPCRTCSEAAYDGIFCSELVAAFYKRIGVLPSRVVPSNCVPADFLGHGMDADGDIPGDLCRVRELTYVATRQDKEYPSIAVD